MDALNHSNASHLYSVTDFLKHALRSKVLTKKYHLTPGKATGFQAWMKSRNKRLVYNPKEYKPLLLWYLTH